MSEIRVKDALTGGEKGSKPERYDLLPPVALDEVARVFGYGAGKYELRNWEKGYDWGLSIAALHRHVKAFERREDRDPESGLHHLAHAAFHCLALMAWQANGRGTDSRTFLTGPVTAQEPSGATTGDCCGQCHGKAPAPSVAQLEALGAATSRHFANLVMDEMKRKRERELEFISDHEFIDPKTGGVI